VCGRCVEVRLFGVGEEGVRPPYLLQHLIADAQLVLAGFTEVQTVIGPVLPEVEVKREVLRATGARQTNGNELTSKRHIKKLLERCRNRS
jgi:hypothetical protein